MSESKLFELVSNMERDIRRLSNYVIKDESYLDYDEKILGASCIAFVRAVNGFYELWPQELSTLSGINYDQIQNCYELFLK